LRLWCNGTDTRNAGRLLLSLYDVPAPVVRFLFTPEPFDFPSRFV
jgi:hypothetical protein